MYQIFETSDNSSIDSEKGVVDISLAQQLEMSPEDLLALNLFSKDQVTFLRQKSLLVKNLYEN